MVDFEKIDDAYKRFSAADNTEERKAIFESLSKEEQFELRHMMIVEEREKIYPEPVRSVWKREFDGADTDKKLEMLYDALKDAIMEIEILKSAAGVVGATLNRMNKR